MNRYTNIFVVTKYIHSGTKENNTLVLKKFTKPSTQEKKIFSDWK